MAPSRACSASMLCGALRNAGAPASGASFRTFESNRAMGPDYAFRFGRYLDLWSRAAIKRLSRGKRKHPAALCPIHTMPIGISRPCGGFALDGFRGDANCAQPKVLENF